MSRTSDGIIIKKVYEIGGRTFDSLVEARKHAVDYKNNFVKNKLIEIFDQNINWEGWTGDSSEIANAVDEILKMFIVKVRK